MFHRFGRVNLGEHDHQSSHCIVTRPKKRKQTCSSGNSFADAPDAAGDDDAAGAVDCVVDADDLALLAKLVNCLD